jgi:hypothetical protein
MEPFFGPSNTPDARVSSGIGLRPSSIPELLADPVAVFESKAESGSLAIVLEAQDASGQPALARASTGGCRAPSRMTFMPYTNADAINSLREKIPTFRCIV